MSSDDRRAEPRRAADAPLYLMWHDGQSSHAARGRLLESSERGIRFRTPARIHTGAIVFCAVPAHGICSRFQVCHSRRAAFRTEAGARILASF